MRNAPQTGNQHETRAGNSAPQARAARRPGGLGNLRRLRGAAASRARAAAIAAPHAVIRAGRSALGAEMSPLPAFAVGRELAVAPADSGSGRRGVITRFGCTAVRGTPGVRGQHRTGYKLGQQTACALRFQRFASIPVSGGALRYRALLQHPSRKERQRRLLHHFVEQNGEFAAQIGDVFQFGHLKVAQRSAGTFSKIFHRWIRKVVHRMAPGGLAVVLLAPRPVSVTELGACAKEVSPVEIFPGPAGPWPLGGLARGPAGG